MKTLTKRFFFSKIKKFCKEIFDFNKKILNLKKKYLFDNYIFSCTKIECGAELKNDILGDTYFK